MAWGWLWIYLQISLEKENRIVSCGWIGGSGGTGTEEQIERGSEEGNDGENIGERPLKLRATWGAISKSIIV